MNVLQDILKLQQIATTSLVRTGFGMTEVAGQFQDRMKGAIKSAFVSLCMTHEESCACKSDADLPGLDAMCKRLKGLDQMTPLPPHSQAYYYCAVAILLTMEGCEAEHAMVQQMRALMYINSGALSGKKQ